MNLNDERFKELASKYRMKIINGNRYYNIIIGDDDFCCKDTSPISINIGGKIIYENKWTQMLLSVLTYLDRLCYKTDFELLSIKVPNSKRLIFTDFKKNKGNSGFEFRPGLFFQNATDAEFAGTIIKELLKIYNIADLNDCELCVHYAGYNEPSEVCDYIIGENKKSFKEYLLSLKVKKLTDNYIDKVISNADKISSKLFKGEVYTHQYKNLFLFSDYSIFLDCKNYIIDAMYDEIDLAKTFDEFSVSSYDDFIFDSESSLIIPDENSISQHKLNQMNSNKDRAMDDLENVKIILDLLDGYYLLEEELNCLEHY